MKPTHNIEDVPDNFFIILISLIPHKVLKEFSKHCRIYSRVVRQYVRIDGHVALVVSENTTCDEPEVAGADYYLMEAFCQGVLRQVGIHKCPICRDRHPDTVTCGHLVFEGLK